MKLPTNTATRSLGLVGARRKLQRLLAEMAHLRGGIDVIIHRDLKTDSYWAAVAQLPGCFAVGRSRQELDESLKEAISLYLEGENEAEILTSDHVEAVEHYRFSQDGGLVRA